MVGLLGDVISANRKILQDVQYHDKGKWNYSQDMECERNEKSSDLVKMSQGIQNEKKTAYNRIRPFHAMKNDTRTEGLYWIWQNI